MQLGALSNMGLCLSDMKTYEDLHLAGSFWCSSVHHVQPQFRSEWESNSHETISGTGSKSEPSIIYRSQQQLLYKGPTSKCCMKVLTAGVVLLGLAASLQVLYKGPCCILVFGISTSDFSLTSCKLHIYFQFQSVECFGDQTNLTKGANKKFITKSGTFN